MASKGIAWLPVAIGIIFLAQILIYSVMFTKVTVFSREVQDANILFEGDEIETYARSIENSVQLSIAQGLNDFYLDHRLELWQSYSARDLMPTAAATESQVKANADKHARGFFDAHQKFASDQKNGMVFKIPSESSLTVGADKVSMKFSPETEISKSFFGTEYSRKFVAESTLVTVFGAMMKSIRDDLIGGDMVGKYVLEAIGKPYPAEGKRECSVEPSKYKNRAEHSTKTLAFYIDDDASVPGGNAHFARLEKHLLGSQDTTRGTIRFCNLDDYQRSPVSCACTDPCKNPENVPAMHDPPPEELYPMTHTKSYGEASANVEKYIKQRLVCLESELDDKSLSYTVAFDGDNKNLGLGDHTISSKAEVTDVGTKLDKNGPQCGPGIVIRKCGTCPCSGEGCKPPPRYEYKCPYIDERSYDYQHLGAAQVDVRFQEDGFVYGFWDSSGKTTVPDTIKLIFKLISGNKNLI